MLGGTYRSRDMSVRWRWLLASPQPLALKRSWNSNATRCVVMRQNYFTRILEDNLKAIIKPQYVDHIPRAVNGCVGEVLMARDQRGKNESLLELLGTSPPPQACCVDGRATFTLREGKPRFAASPKPLAWCVFVCVSGSIDALWRRRVFARGVSDLQPVLERNVGDLSGGELQRFAIAVVAVQEADIYMFDEPSSYLDVKQRLKAAQVRSRPPRTLRCP